MQGPTQRWDQPPDPRESTVSMPRIDPSSLAGQVSERATAAYDGGTGMELPGFGDPYALPVRAGEPAPSREGGSGPAGSPAAPGGPVSPRPVPEPAPDPAADLAVTPESVTPAGPAVADPRDAEAPPLPAGPDPPEPDELVAFETPGRPGAISQGALGKRQRRAVRRADPGTAGRPVPGSIAELRGRLERLPDGHPSSPYDDAGWLKPSPTRLRQLELGLPARSLSTPAGYADRFGLDPDDELPGTAPPKTPDTDNAAVGAGSARRETRRPATSADALQGPVTQPPNAPSTATGPTASNGHHDSDDGDGRVRLLHPYEDSVEPDRAADSSSALTLTRPVSDSGSGPDDQRNGHHPPAKPPEDSRAEPARPDRQRPRPDQGRGELPHRGDGAAARQQLAPELREIVDRILAACRAAEGRNARGGYGTSGLTPALRRIAAQLPAGGLAPGSEADTLKPADRLATRLARLIERQPGRPPAELAATISDAIRYAFTFPASDYTEATLLVHRKLKAQGFDLEARRNQWDSREYKGVFTRWRDPAHGLAFEVQFHTPDSWAVVKQTHDAYLRITDPLTSAAERARLRARQGAAAATVSLPPGCLDIADFRAGVR